MVEARDLYWAAGFIDGEGCFTGEKGKATTPHTGVTNTDLELLERLKSLFGGSIYVKKAGPLSRKVCYEWRLYGVGLMMTLYSLLSTRRQQKIQSIIAAWRIRPYHTGPGRPAKRKD